MKKLIQQTTRLSQDCVYLIVRLELIHGGAPEVFIFEAPNTPNQMQNLEVFSNEKDTVFVAFGSDVLPLSVDGSITHTLSVKAAQSASGFEEFAEVITAVQ